MTEPIIINVKMPEPNFEMQSGDIPKCLRISLSVKKTIRNRIKWWLFFQFFPFKLLRWDKEDPE